MFIPAIRSVIKTHTHARDATPLKTFKKRTTMTGMVIIPFRHVPRLKRFRWGQEWWTKTTVFKATNGEFHEFEIPPEDKVGVFLKELPEEARKWIVTK